MFPAPARNGFMTERSHTVRGLALREVSLLCYGCSTPQGSLLQFLLSGSGECSGLGQSVVNLTGCSLVGLLRPDAISTRAGASQNFMVRRRGACRGL